MEFIYFVGVDVSKGELDFAIYKEKELLFHKETSNNQKAISQFIKELQKLDGFELSKTIFCMEHTGIYNNPLLVFLHKKKGNIWLEAATKIKNSLGNIRGKNDKLDAIRIGCFAYKNRDEIRLWKPKRAVVVSLTDLTTVRKRLIKAKKQLKIPLKELVGFSKNSSINKQLKICQRTLNSLEADIKKDLKIAVMGCIVNGPGEAVDADFALVGGKQKFAIYRKGKFVKSVVEKKAVSEFLKIIKI